MSIRKVEIDLAAAGTLGAWFIAELDALRESEPVPWSAASKCWLVTRHADVDLALQGRLPLSTKRLVPIGLGAIPEQDRLRLFPTMMRYMPQIAFRELFDLRLRAIPRVLNDQSIRSPA